MSTNDTSTFNQSTKNAVLAAKPSKKCCKRAHLLGMLLFGQVFGMGEIRIVGENEHILDHAAGLLKSLVDVDVSPFRETLSNQGKIDIKDEEICSKILAFFGYDKKELTTSYTILSEIFKCENCKTEFIKGVFLSCGNVSSPRKSYHLEFNVSYFNLSRELLFFLKGMSFEAKYTKRSSHYVIYYKESEKIVDFLGLIGATKENFEYNNTLIAKDIRNNLNRLNNCEMANMTKQIQSASKQIEAINKLFATGGAESLSDDLLETARLRIENPEASLSQLAELHDPPVTKSCVNRRLKNLTQEV